MADEIDEELDEGMDEELEQRIRDIAYKLWEDAGKPSDTPDKFWYQAVLQLEREDREQRPNNRSNAKAR